MGFYEDMAATARDLLAPTSDGGLGQGVIELVAYIPGVDGPDPWSPPSAPTRSVTTLDGAARGVGKELVGTPVENGGQIVATDLVVTVAPWGGAINPAHVLEVDGSPVTILSVKNIPAAGTLCLVQMVVRK